jgi:hypothetical protein
MNKIRASNKILNYILVFILVATSGIYYFYSSIEYVIIGVAIVIISFFILNTWQRLDRIAILIISLFVMWEAIQFFILGGFEFQPIFGTLIRFFLAYGVIKIVDNKFIPTYINIIYFFSIISLLFYCLYFIPDVTESLIKFSNQIKPVFEMKSEFGSDWRRNIIIFNFHGYEFEPKRNSGPFWEPGAFVIFLNLALFFHLTLKNSIFSKKSIVLIVSIISTYSTTGILTLFLIIAWHLYQTKIGYFLRLILLIPIVLIFINLYIKVDFLGDKVQANITEAPETTTSRFGSALADWYIFKQNPILGFGRNIEARYGLSYYDPVLMHRNNGITNFLVQWGILLTILYFFLYYKSMRNYIIFLKSRNKYSAIVGFIIILLCGFSQGIFQYPFFHAFIFLGLVVYKKSNTFQKQNEIYQIKNSTNFISTS